MTGRADAGWIEVIPRVEIQLLEDGNVRVTDEHLGDSYSVDLHPIHLRLIAERLGLAREIPASEADALYMVDKLARRMKVLHDRIAQMDKWLWEHSDHEDADISVEIWYSAATMELSNEFQAEIAESRAAVVPARREACAGLAVTASQVGSLKAAPMGRTMPAPAKPRANPAVTPGFSLPGQLELEPT